MGIGAMFGYGVDKKRKNLDAMEVNEKGLLGFAAPESRGSGKAPRRREHRVNRAVN